MRKGKFNQDLPLLILRLGFGGLMFFGHGLPKMLLFPEQTGTFADPIGVGSSISLAIVVFAQAICAFAILIGIFTRYAALPLVAVLIIQAFMVNGAAAWQQKEFALLYALLFLSFFFTGAGKYSVDHLLGRK